MFIYRKALGLLLHIALVPIVRFKDEFYFVKAQRFIREH